MTKAEERRAYLAQSAAKPQETTKNTISKADQRRMQLQQAQQPIQQVVAQQPVAQQPVVQQPVQPKNNGILSSAGLSGLKAMDNRPAETIPVKKQSIAEQSRNYINSLAPIQQASAYATSRPVVANNQKKAELKKQIDELNKNTNRSFSTNDFTLDTNFAEQQRHINELAEEVARKKEIAENSKGLKENERYVREYNEKLAELNKATNDYNNALKYDKKQGNMASDIAKSLDTNTKGGMANIMSGWSRTGSKLSGYDATTIDANALYNYMQPQEESDNPYALLGNALREGASYYGTRVMPGGAAVNETLGGGIETPNVAFGRLEDLHKMYPNNLELTNLYNAIASRQYNGTAEDLKKALNDVQLSLDRQFQNQYFQDEYDAVQNQAIRNENKYGGAAWIPNAFGTVGNMLPSILMGYATGGIGELAGGGSMALAGSAANKAQQLGSLGNLGMGAANQGTNQAIAEGADYNQALQYGALTGLTEAGTEMIGGEAVNAAFGQVGKSVLGKLVGKGIDKLGIKSKVGKVIAGLASDIAGEATEEMISEAVNPLWKAATYDADALPKNSEELGQYFKDIFNAGLEAIPSTLLMAGGGNIVRVGKVNQIENGILKSIQESDLSPIVKTQLENEVRKSSTDVKLGLEEADTIQSAVNTRASELAQQSAEIAARIPEGYSLPQSTIDILSYTENNRPGLNIAFDTNIQGNGTFVENPDGTRTITLNPNSKRAVEFTLTHELGHDLKGTGEYTQLQNILTDYAKGKPGYQEALKSLDQTYRESGANYNLQDEATNDMLGQAIGEQEFYNKLAENPTLFNRITNKLKSLVGNKDTKLKNKIEKLTSNALKQEYRGGQQGPQQSISDVTDSKGRQLTVDQENYFKDSKVRDDNGNLIPVYHGTNTDFTVFNQGDGALGKGIYFAESKDYAKGHSQNGKIIEAYLDIKNPYVTDYPGNYNQEELKEKGYDGIYHTGNKFWVAFEPNQVKNINNLTPTTSEDIRYSLSEADETTPTKDSKGRTLTPEQQDFFKGISPEMLDSSGNIVTLYHASPNQFDTFDKNRIRSGVTMYANSGDGFYFTDSQKQADRYGKGTGTIYEVYLNLKHPLVVENNLTDEAKQVLTDFSNLMLERHKAEIGKEDFGRYEKFDPDGVGQRSGGAILSSVVRNYGDEFTEYLKSKGYDGIKESITDYNNTGTKYDYIAFEPEQIKDVSNKKPTSNPNIHYSLSEDTAPTTDNQGRQLSKGQQTYFRDSKIKDVDGKLLTMYHGTNGDFYTFDLGKIGNNTKNAGNFGDGFYFTYSKDRAKDYGKNVKETYLNIQNPFSYDSLYYLPNGTESYSDYTVITNLVNMNNEWGKIPIKFGSKYTWQDIADTVNKMSNEGATDSQIDSALYEKYGDIAEQGLPDRIYTYAKQEGYKTLREALAEQGYDGIIDGKTAQDSSQIVAFNSNQIKNIDNQNPTENEDIRYSKQNGKWQNFVEENFNLKPGTKTNFLPTNEELQQQVTNRISQDAQALNLQEPEVKLTESDDDTLFSLSEQEKKEVNNYIDQLFNDILLDEKFRNRIADRLNKVQNYNQFKQIKEDVNEYKRNNSKGLVVDKNDAKEIIQNNLGKFPGNSKTINNVVDEINKGLADGTLTDTKINDLVDKLGDTYKTVDSTYYDAYVDLKRDIQKRRIYVPEEIKRGITDYNDFRKANMGNLKLTSDRTNSTGIDQVYKELQETYPDMFPDDIYNPIDQLEHIADVAAGIRKRTRSARKSFEREFGAEAWDEVGSELRQDLVALKDKAIYREMDSIKTDMDEAAEYTDEQVEKIAELLKERPEQQKRTFKENLQNAYKTLVNKGYFVDKLAEVSGNKQLMYKYDKMLASANEGNYVVGEKQTNNKGKIIGKSVNEIWKPVEEADKVQEFSEYLLHKLNIDRMSLENPDNVLTAETNFSNFIQEHPEFTRMSSNKIKKLALEDTAQGKLAQQYLDLDNQVEVMENRKNKPVFGENVTAEDSKRAVAEIEKNNPEFKEWAKDINTFNKNQLQNMVDAGLTSEETQDLLNSMYDNYIRIQRDIGGDSPIVNQRGRLKINSPIKKAKGGNQNILPLKDSMAQQALEVKKAIARNTFGLELLNTLQNGETVQDYGEVLQEGKKGEAPTFTVFKGGQPITMKINNELYDAIKPSQRASWEDSVIANGLQKAVVLQKTLLTSKNPIFAFTNFVRDLQTAMVNSKSTTKMLKNYAKLAQYKFAEYFNNKANKFTDFINKKAGTQKLQNKELNSKYSQLADLWQLYKANGGESNTYFDFEKGTNLEAKNPVSKAVNWLDNKIFGINEVIEQMPRVAEFISTLENGGTVEEAMYNAADVTVNFKRGGEFTKMLDRNGASFLNASVQGLDKQIRNFTKGGAKGFANALVKTALLGIAPQLLNHLLMGDDDDYEDLPDYIKDNYWLIKTGDNQFLRIPRGRDIPTFIGVLSQRTARALKGDDHAFDGLVDTFSNNLAPNNPLDSNIFSPITAMTTNKSWSGNDIVSSTLSNKEASEQYDAKDTEFAKWLAGTDLGKKMELSPKKIDYLLDQYSGGIGDILIPMNTKYAEQGNAFSSKFTTDSVTNNKQLSRFYDDKTALEKKKNSKTASDEQLYQYKYFSDVADNINELNKEKRDIEMSDLTDKEKISQVTEIQKEINSLAKEANKNAKEYGEAANDYSYSIFDDLNKTKAYTDSFHVGEEGQADIKQQILTDGNLKAQEKLGFITDADEDDDNYSKKLSTLNTKLDKLEEADIPLADYYLTWYAQKNVSKKNAKQTAISQTIDYINEGDHQLSKEQKNVLYEIFNVK